MKNIILLLMFTVFFNSRVFSQDEIQGWVHVEIYIGIINLNEEYDAIRFEMKDLNNGISHFYPPVESGYNAILNTVLDVTPYQTWLGFDCTNSGVTDYHGYVIPDKPLVEMENYNQHGLYKVKIFKYDSMLGDFKENVDSFYFDTRDLRYTGYAPPVNGHPTDIWLKYDDLTSPKLFLRSDAPNILDSNNNELFEEPFNSIWEPINSNTLKTIWDIKKGGFEDAGYPVTTQTMFDNGLVMINNGHGNPRLFWCASPNGVPPNSYKIFRAITSTTNPKFRIYNLVATVSNSEFNWTDNDVSLGSSQYIYYYVRAEFGTSGYNSNVINTTGALRKSANTNGLNENNIYVLLDNYPNPFNPTTNISYSIPQREFVSLKVYNTLGKEVAILESGYKNEGNYNVEFNASNLPSGV